MDVYEFFREYARMFKTYRKGVTITNMYITAEGFCHQIKKCLLNFQQHKSRLIR